jgi:hypothetical protein
MATLHAQEPIGCPADAASELIEPAIRAISAGETLAVRVPVEPSGSEDGITLEHDVRFRTSHVRDASGLNDLTVITWESGSPIPMPQFSGTITADFDAAGTQPVLVLDGAYDPPGGMAGAAFDALLGSRIARATMHELLHRMAGAIEVLYEGARTSPAPFSEEPT